MSLCVSSWGWRAGVRVVAILLVVLGHTYAFLPADNQVIVIIIRITIIIIIVIIISSSSNSIIIILILILTLILLVVLGHTHAFLPANNQAYDRQVRDGRRSLLLPPGAF